MSEQFDDNAEIKLVHTTQTDQLIDILKDLIIHLQTHGNVEVGDYWGRLEHIKSGWIDETR